MSGSDVKKPTFVILNLFQDNKQRWRVILKQVQDDETEFETIRERALADRCKGRRGAAVIAI